MPNEEMQTDPAEMSRSMLENYSVSGNLTSLSCPACGGAIWESHRNNLLSFRCHVGHAFSLESFLTEQAEEIEINLWTALRTLKDRAKIFRQLAAENHKQADSVVAQQLERQSKNALQRAEMLRQILQTGELESEPR